MSTQEPSGTAPDEGLRAEVGKIMQDPGWGRDKALEARVDQLYRDRYGSGQVTIDDGLSIGGPPKTQAGETPEAAEARARNDLILAPLRKEWGDGFEGQYAASREVAQSLFGDHEWGHPPALVFQDIGTRIRRDYGPKGETLTLKFLADLAKIKKGG